MTVLGGGCHSLGCRGYLCATLEACIWLRTTTHFHSHLPQAHLLAMSLNKADNNKESLKVQQFVSTKHGNNLNSGHSEIQYVLFFVLTSEVKIAGSPPSSISSTSSDVFVFPAI